MQKWHLLGNGGFVQSAARCRVTSPQLKHRTRLPGGKGRLPPRVWALSPLTAVASHPREDFLQDKISEYMLESSQCFETSQEI